MAEPGVDNDVNDFEVCIRFNNDSEKDYNFQISTETTFNDLKKIFKLLPIPLRPSIFYDVSPSSFGYSVSPGYLTANGALLFTGDATKKKYIKYSKSQNDKVSDYVWPSQLIVPVWKFNHFRHLSYISVLLIWLYTDLPDFISPTPGICFSNQCIKFAAWAFIAFTGDANHNFVKNMLKELKPDSSSITGQCFFFVFHVIKTLVVYGFFAGGFLNPLNDSYLENAINRTKSLITGSTNSEKASIDPNTLVKLGWTGSRKCSTDDYKEEYRKHIITVNGGIVKTHQKGLLKDLNKRLGLQLKDGQGFATPLPEDHRKRLLSLPLMLLNVKVFKEHTDKIIKFLETDDAENNYDDSLFADENGEFKLSYEFISYYHIAFIYYNNLTKNEDFNKGLFRFNSLEEVRNFRRYGSFSTNNPSWVKFIDNKFESLIKENEDKKTK